MNSVYMHKFKVYNTIYINRAREKDQKQLGMEEQ